MAAGPKMCVTLDDIPEQLLISILERVTLRTAGFSHALVCKKWYGLRDSAQVAVRAKPGAAWPMGALLRELFQFRELKCIVLPDHSLRLFSDRALDLVADSFPRINSLHVSQPHEVNITVQGMHSFCCKSPGIRMLSLVGMDCIIPSSITELHSLEDLRSDNIESLPGNFGQMTSLKRLALSSQHMDRLPESLGSLQELQHLSLGTPALQNLPESILTLTKLTYLFIDASSLSSLPVSIGDLTQLKKLAVSSGENQEFRHLPASLAQLSSLASLRLDCNRLFELPPNLLDSLTGLTELHIGSGLSADVAEDLGNLLLIQKLSIWGLKGRIPESICSLANLRKMSLYCCVPPSGSLLPDNLGQLIQLQELRLEACMGLWMLPDVGGLASLKILKFESCNDLAALPPGIESLTLLETLSVVCSTAFQEVSESLCSLKSLRRLSFVDCGNLTEIPETLLALTQLEELRLDCCPGLNSEMLRSFLELSSLSASSRDSLSSLAQSMRVPSSTVLQSDDSPGEDGALPSQTSHFQYPPHPPAWLPFGNTEAHDIHQPRALAGQQGSGGPHMHGWGNSRERPSSGLGATSRGTPVSLRGLLGLLKGQRRTTARRKFWPFGFLGTS